MGNYVYNYDKEQETVAPPPRLKEDRSPVKFFLLNAITLGIYSIFFYMPFSFDINRLTPAQNKKTMNYLFAYLISFVTGNIFLYIWFGMISGQIASELQRRQISCKFKMQTYAIWYLALPLGLSIVTSICAFLINFEIVENALIPSLILLGATGVSIAAPYVFHTKLINAANLLCADFNRENQPNDFQ